METDFKSNSQAAHYVKLRNQFPLSRVYRARDMWAKAKAASVKAEAAREARESASAALSDFWESLGKKEPKRFSPEGQRLAALRGKERETSRAYFRACAPTPHKPFFHNRKTRNAVPQGEAGIFYLPDAESMFRIHYSDNEFFTHPDAMSDETCRGVVAFLPGRNGQCRAVPGYQFRAMDDGGATFDFSDIRVEHGEDSDALLRDCMITADSWAENKAESEREYQAAWQAGAYYADLKERESEIRQEILATLKERKAANGGIALCRALREWLSDKLEERAALRAEREELKEGSAENYWWDSYDSTLQSAFNDGAGI